MSYEVVRKIEQLHSEFPDWHAKYQLENPGVHSSIAGFNMPYSPSETWNTENDTLILTTNPRAQPTIANEGKEIRETEHVPQYVWPEANELYNAEFNNKNKYTRAIGQVALGFGDAPEIAMSSYAMWSVVPYRTNTAAEVPDKLWEMALYRIWGPIFKLWLPANIIVFGKDAHEVIKNAIHMHAFFVYEEKEKTANHEPGLRYTSFKAPAGKIINLYGLPHPSRFCQFYTGERSRALEFIARMQSAACKNLQQEQNL